MLVAKWFVRLKRSVRPKTIAWTKTPARASIKLGIVALSTGMLLAACSPESRPTELPNDQPIESQSVDPKPGLDLSREALAETILSDERQDREELADVETLLPDLFDEEADKKAKLRGKVLTNEDAQDLQSSVDGVQIDLEIPTR